MSTNDFRQGSTKFLVLKSDTIAVGTNLNGWLLDRRGQDFAAHTTTQLLREWDFLGIDFYQAGSQSKPGAGAARGNYNVETWLEERGFGDMPNRDR